MSEQTQEQAVDLKPCPFCGGEAEQYQDGDMEGWSVTALHNTGCPLDTFAYETQAAANEAWNRRPSPPQAFDPVEAIAEIHRMLKPGRPLHTPEMNYHCIVDHLSPEIDLPFDVAASPTAPDIAQPYDQSRERQECATCHGAREIFGHSEECDDDLCALNGDIHSCAGLISACTDCPSPSPELIGVDQMRRRFEAVYEQLVECGHDIGADGEYVAASMQTAWIIWCAAIGAKP